MALWVSARSGSLLRPEIAVASRNPKYVVQIQGRLETGCMRAKRRQFVTPDLGALCPWWIFEGFGLFLAGSILFDQVDTEYCCRLRAAGNHRRRSPEPEFCCTHRLSQKDFASSFSASEPSTTTP